MKNFPKKKHFIPETIPKVYQFSKGSTGSTSSGLESQSKLCFFICFITKNCTKVHFFKHQKQLHPMSI